ncbi:response regulator [Microbulbifer sp. SAOS-129_SWC]|uniref:ATP-binding response regulator n=1 Tax=Microbulbifer sp. SAOS-129_SWC TaxID=3145235 RepID=UPI00321660F6
MNKTIWPPRLSGPRTLPIVIFSLTPAGALAASAPLSLTATLLPLYWVVALGVALLIAAGAAAVFGVRLRRERALGKERTAALRAENHKLFRQQQTTGNELAAQQRLLTEARQAIAHQQQEKSDTLAVAGHRLRQPLDGLQSTLNLLERSTGAETGELAAIARRQLRAALQVLEQIHNLGELETVELTEPRAPAPPSAALSILLIESGEHDSLYTALEIRGHRVQRESNGIDGADAALQKQFDLILIDTHLPLIDGVEATQKIRRDSGGAVPIFALIAGLRRGDQEHYRARGFTGVLARPVAEFQLEQLLNWAKRRTRSTAATGPQDQTPRPTRLLNSATLGRQYDTLGPRAFAELLSNRTATLPRKATALTSALTGRHWPDAIRMAPALAASAAEIGLEAAAARLRALSARLAIEGEREYCRHQRTEILNLMRESIEQLKSWRAQNMRPAQA